MSEQLNLNNFLNVAGFALSWVLNSDVMRGPGGQDEGGNMFLRGIGQLFETFESIVMPTSQTFLIAHLILILEGAFAITQLLPKYRGSVMVQESVKHYFFLSALMQFLWSVDIGIQNLWAAAVSVIFMLSMFVSITKILISQAANTDSSQTPEEYWLLRFPFSMHFAWALAIASMSVNGFFVQLGVGSTFQVVLGVITVLLFAGVGYKMLFKNGPMPNYVVPMVLSWFLFGIALIQQGPKVELQGLQRLFFDAVAGITGAGMIGTTAYVFYNKEIADKKNDLSKEINDINNKDDTVYVTAPDGKGGELA